MKKVSRHPPASAWNWGVTRKAIPMIRSMPAKERPLVKDIRWRGIHCWMMSARGDWVEVKKRPAPTRPMKRAARMGEPALQQRRTPNPQEQQGHGPPGPEAGGEQVGRDAEDQVGNEDRGAEQPLGQGRKVHLLGDVRQQNADDEYDTKGCAYTGGDGCYECPASEAGTFNRGLQSGSRGWGVFYRCGGC